MKSKFELIHQTSGRFEEYAKLTPIIWEPGIDAWVTAEPLVIREILTSQDFAVMDLGATYKIISDQLKINLQPTINVFEKIPLALAGEPHRTARKQMAEILKVKANLAMVAYCSTLDDRLKKAFSGAKRIDISKEVITPAIDDMFRELSGIPPDDGADVTLSQLFDRRISMNKRKALNEQIVTTSNNIQQHCSEDEKKMKLAISILGADTLFASICASLTFVLKEHPGIPLSKIDWPKDLPQTGLPYVDRLASKDILLEGKSIKKGDRIRLYLDNLSTEADAHRKGMFGLGIHSCLGKAICIKAWSELTARLSKIDATLTTTRYEYRKSDFLFNTPTKFEVEIHHA